MTVPASPERPSLLTARPAGPLPGTRKVGGTGRNLWLHALVLGWFVAEAVLVVVHRFVPDALWLMVHVLMLGAVSTAILVWSQHFADTMLRRQAPGGRPLHVARLAAHTVGALLVVAGLLTDVWSLVVAGGVLVGTGAVTHATVLVLQGRGALPSRFGRLVRYYVVAAACLPVGVTLGVLLARGGAGTEAYGRLYVAHVTLNVLGWVGLTVLGTLVLLWPTVLRTRIEPDADVAARRALPVLTAGILLVVAACAVGWRPLVAAGATVVLGGTVTVGRHLAAQGRAAQRGAWGFAAWSLAASVVWFAGSVAAFGARVATAPSWAAAQDAIGGLLLPFVVGFAAQVLLGALTYLVPVVLGGGPARRRRTEAVVGAGGAYRVLVANGGLALYLLPLPSWVRVGLSLVVFATFLAFLVLALRAVFVSRGGPVPAGETVPRGRPDPAGETVQRPEASRPTAAPSPAQPPGRGAASPAADAPASGTRRGEAARAVAARRDAQARRPLAGAVTAAVATLALAVVGGVAADPVAAGVGSGVVGGGAVAGTGGAGVPVAATGRTTTVQVDAADMRFVPDTISVPAGDRLVIELTNTDDDVHDLVLADGATTGRVAPGATATLDAGVVSGDLDGWCSVAGHRLMGMTLTVEVTGGAALADPPGPEEAPAAEGAHAGHGTSSGTDSLGVADAELLGGPGDGFVARDATLAPAETDPSGGPVVHRRTLIVTEVAQEVAPGVEQTVWTFGGTAPGPVLRGKVGDVFEITLVNDGTIGHSIDFHAGALAPDEPMRTIAPGESLTYRFTATRAGIWMYHCSTMPMSLHIANGMFGAVIVDPPDLGPVDREYVVVQSELYLGAQGASADDAKVAAAEPDLLTFNGYANQYRYDPLGARVGERVRVWVLDAGPNRPSAFHVVGGQFDTVYHEGAYALPPGTSGGSQVLGLLPAQGGFVELTFPEAGTYPFVTHAMSDAERGASGTFAVTP
ncbi:multicopper oxidase domain-containing protein [Cellulosimicrobium cellulans]|uniref:multicopper oxidase domain-containing protein n=1 Tax=Cellulosimicrobium cellulans TaxID=1710 RepID=UPI0020980DC8|nr:multicopper oxidase domain-containing protein [Cellulosimicrobium cellulans]MCO7272874.1 multicopper oxidase domain-containing protein [Cellulosimicrobium cellulans]